MVREVSSRLLLLGSTKRTKDRPTVRPVSIDNKAVVPFETKDAILVTNLIFVLAMFILIPMKASTICTTNLSTFRKKNEREKKKISFVEKYIV